MNSNKRFLSELILIVGILLFIAVGSFVFKDRRYMPISYGIAILSCLIFFVSFENRNKTTTRLVILAAITALSVAGRAIFAPLPFFKPVTAIVIICGVNMGAESGFLCGALSALISNFIFFQGPWTPFQMFIWGLIGFLSGSLSSVIKSNRIVLLSFGALSGVLYSVFMDIWTTVWWDGTFLTSRYLAAIITALPITAVYAVSNVIFLMALSKPLGQQFDRLHKKYGI